MYVLAYLPADQFKDKFFNEIQTKVDMLKDQWPVYQAVESGQFCLLCSLQLHLWIKE